MNATFIATAAEAYIRQAIAELRGLDQQISALSPLSLGVVRFAASVDRSEFLARVKAREPVFVRHLHPVDMEVALSGEPADLDRLAEAGRSLLGADCGGRSVSVQVRRFGGGEGPVGRVEVRERLDSVVAEAGARPVTQGADLILSVTIAEHTACLGLSTAADNLSDWPGGEIRFRREEEQLSRAKFKLLEAFDRFEIPVPPGGKALDLGAAPGGWTSLLLEKGMQVTAVDTGEMGEAIRQHPQLTFLRKNVDEVDFPPDRFDLVTCDMSWNPLNTARMVARLAPSARQGAHLILTVKLMLQNPTRTIRLVGEGLSEHYQLLQTKQLFHNRDEVTMHLVRR